MPCVCPENQTTVDRVAHLLDAMMGIDGDDLEKVVQQAHESDSKQMGDPTERFPVTRQALRMFWHFRCNLEAVMPHRREG